MKIYRAANDDHVMAGYSFAKSRKDAEAYLDNPGFGGSKMFSATVSGEYIEFGREDWDALGDAIGRKIEPAKYAYHFARAITTDDDIIGALAEAGFDYVLFEDDYPQGCITVVPVSDAAVESIEDTIR